MLHFLDSVILLTALDFYFGISLRLDFLQFLNTPLDWAVSIPEYSTGLSCSFIESKRRDVISYPYKSCLCTFWHYHPYFILCFFMLVNYYQHYAMSCKFSGFSCVFLHWIFMISHAMQVNLKHHRDVTWHCTLILL